MSAESIFGKPVSKQQQAVLDRMAERQAAGDDSHIDYSDAPELTDEQLATGRRGKRFVPVYLNQPLQDYLVAAAERKGVAFNDLVNDLLSKEVAIAEAIK